MNSKLTTCKTCGNNVSSSAPTCPHCGEVNPGQHDVAELAQNNERPEHIESSKEKSGPITIVAGLAIFIVILLGVGGVIVAFSKSDTPSPNENEAVAIAPSQVIEDHSSMAVVQCQSYMRLSLKAPATADFPLWDHHVSKQENNVYLVRSYVDAQNGFGANIRTNYYCDIRFTGGDKAEQSNWVLVNMKTH